MYEQSPDQPFKGQKATVAANVKQILSCQLLSLRLLDGSTLPFISLFR